MGVASFGGGDSEGATDQLGDGALGEADSFVGSIVFVPVVVEFGAVLQVLAGNLVGIDRINSEGHFRMSDRSPRRSRFSWVISSQLRRGTPEATISARIWCSC